MRIQFEAHYVRFLFGGGSKGPFFSFTDSGIIFITDSIITNDSTIFLNSYSFFIVSSESSLVLSNVNVNSVNLGGTSSSLISSLGSSSITILSSNFTYVVSIGQSSAIFSDMSGISDKTITLLVNSTLFSQITTTASSTGVVLCVGGGINTNVIIHNSNFNGITESSASVSVNILGGGVYVGSANLVEIDGSLFSNITSVYSGGGAYVGTDGNVLITNCLFQNITVSYSGGVLHVVCILNVKCVFFFLCYIFFVIYYFN